MPEELRTLLENMLANPSEYHVSRRSVGSPVQLADGSWKFQVFGLKPHAEVILRGQSDGHEFEVRVSSTPAHPETLPEQAKAMARIELEGRADGVESD